MLFCGACPNVARLPHGAICPLDPHQPFLAVSCAAQEGTLKVSHGGRSLGTIAGVRGPLHAAVTLTSSRQMAYLVPGPIGKPEHSTEELIHVLKVRVFGKLGQQDIRCIGLVEKTCVHVCVCTCRVILGGLVACE